MADEQRAEAVAPAHVGAQPPADHEDLAERVLDLHPRPAAPAGLVAAVEALADDALEALLARGGQERGALTAVRGRRPPHAAYAGLRSG